MAPVPATPAHGKSSKVPNTSSKTGTAARATRNRGATKDDDEVPTLNTKPSISLFSKGFMSTSGKEKEGKGQKMGSSARSMATGSESPYSESLKAFLRIRPPPEGSSSQYLTTPYLEAQSESEVIMRPPIDPSRPHASKSPNIYSFDKVFPPSTHQATMFTQTTLPLVEKLLQGENGLMLTYGVSNSGKSYTIAGGSGSSERGILPRGIDVIFNSIGDLQSDLPLRCVGVADVEIAAEEEAFARAFDQLQGEVEPSTTESIKVDRNYSYAVFVSYAEVYNEKIFDLLDAVLPSSSATLPAPKSNGNLARPSSTWALSSSLSLAALANGGGGVLKRRALALKNDPEGNGKYVAGLNEVRVRTRDEALAIFRAGQRARQVFGTLANRESSRSHGIFSIKIVRVHNGAPGDIDGVQVSKLSIVDLAGSERNRNTGTTGERLKEAGNINKSLMVLGQCLEVLRSNQQKMAAAASSGSKTKLAVVPFRHSKLTEIFQNSFVGDGSAVMIVNVNPYDTGYDENAHVMRFSAIAQEVKTVPTTKASHGFSGGTLKRQISTHFSALKHAVSGNGQGKIKVMVPVVPKIPSSASTSQTSLPQSDIQMVEEELEIVEVDADETSDEEGDILVDYLFDQIRELKTLLYESEMRNASIEAEVREEVAQEMQETLDIMHVKQQRRLQDQVLASERKTDRKIDIVSRTLPKPSQPRFVRTVRSPTPDAAYLRATPEIDANSSYESQMNETSFESALDGSIVTEEESVVEDSEGDPFIVKVGDTTFDSGLDGNGTFDDGEEGDTTRDTRVDDEEGSTEEEEEEDDDDVDDAEESEDGSGSEYSAFESNLSSSLSPSPVRAARAKPRTTANATPSAPRASTKTPARQTKTPLPRLSIKSTDYSPKVPREPLRESVGQAAMVETDDDSDEGVVTETVKRKRRTLGAKITMPEEMDDGAQRLGGAVIRRLGTRLKLSDGAK